MLWRLLLVTCALSAHAFPELRNDGARPLAPCGVTIAGIYAESGSKKAWDRVIGYHGTSIEAVRYAAAHGVLPGGILTDNSGGVYFYPLLHHPVIAQLMKKKVRLLVNTIPTADDFDDEGLDDTEELVSIPFDAKPRALRGAKDYAKRIAMEHRILSLLEMAFTDANLRAVANFAFNPDDLQAREGLFKAYGKKIPVGKLKTILTKAHEAEGVVLGIDESIVLSHPIANAENGWDGLRITAPVAFSLVAAIEALGTDEEVELRSLRIPLPPVPSSHEQPRKKK